MAIVLPFYTQKFNIRSSTRHCYWVVDNEIFVRAEMVFSCGADPLDWYNRLDDMFHHCWVWFIEADILRFAESA
jgi:hypothetical protein